PQGAHPPAPRSRLSVHRLRALHPCDQAGRTPARGPLVVGGSREQGVRDPHRRRVEVGLNGATSGPVAAPPYRDNCVSWIAAIHRIQSPPYSGPGRSPRELSPPVLLRENHPFKEET